MNDKKDIDCPKIWAVFFLFFEIIIRFVVLLR